MSAAILDIEARRKAMKLTSSQLCAAAGVGRRTYDYARAGIGTVTPATIAKLNAALKRFRLGVGAEAGQMAPHVAFKVCLVLATFHLAGAPIPVKARAALAADPARRATSDPQWLEAARARQLACWIANGQLGFRTTDIARAAGLTKQAVSAAIQVVEDDQGLARIRADIEEVFS